MEDMTSTKGTFIVRVVNAQNSTWQGTVNWTEENRTQPFRSTLELIRLMDSALGSREAEQLAGGTATEHF